MRCIRNVTRDFTPAEVAEITTVSTTLQRDWRRRGILPERATEGWSRFGLRDVIEIYVLKFFADAGFSVKDVRQFTSMAVLPVLKLIGEYPGAIEFDGVEVSEEEKNFLASSIVVGDSGRYLAIAHAPETVHLIGRIRRFSEFRDIETWLAECDADGFTCLDFNRISHRIVERASLPLIRIEIEEGDDGAEKSE